MTASLFELSPMELADVMLLEILARRHGSLVLEPEDASTYALHFDGEDEHETLAEVPAALAKATQLRLALIAGQAFSPPLVAKVSLRTASHLGTADAGTRTVILAIRTSMHGPITEIFSQSAGQHAGAEEVVAGLDGSPPASAKAKYEVIEEIGRGGMGIVYRALHVPLDKEVAIKVLAPAMAQRGDVAAQFVIEARAACRARHPAVIDVTDFGRLRDGRDFLVMEYLAWPTLSKHMSSNRIDPDRVIAVARTIADGLSAAHSQGVVHRDLKPSNIFFGPDDKVKIADFGLAQTSAASDKPSGFEQGCFGTPHYMAPEQASGRRVDHRADLYSFGCILYEMLTGQKPFDGEHSAEVLDAHMNNPPPEVTGVAESLATLCRELLAKDPEERPVSFNAVIERLDDITQELRQP